ncbi:MAG: CBS domain-containing protein [Methylothermaceae bacterium]|nr:CBS domain-containing protein [Methylothermaceae bacterium]
MTIGEICNREVVIVHKDENVIVAAQLMRQHHVGDVVVVEEREGQKVPVGILTDRDMVVKVLAGKLDPSHLNVAEVMSAGLETVNEGEETFPCAERMRGLGIRRLPVVNTAGELVGIVTLDDLIDLLAEQLRDLAAVTTRERRRENRQS